MSHRRLEAMIVIPALITLVIFGSQLGFWDRLPDPLATHWNLSGDANGHMPRAANLALLGGAWLVVWGALAAAGRRTLPSAPSVALSFYIGGLLATLQVSIVSANLDVPTWEQADGVGMGWMAVIVLFSLGLGAGGWTLGKTPKRPVESLTGQAPASGMVPDAGATWIGRAAGHWPVAVAALVLVLIPLIPGYVRWVPVVVAAVTIAFTSVGMTVDSSRVTVGLGWWRWPRRVIPIASISRAEVVVVNPMEWGGYGLRLVPGAAAVVVRKGPGIHLALGDDRRDLLVTVDEPVAGATLINDFIASGER